MVPESLTGCTQLMSADLWAVTEYLDDFSSDWSSHESFMTKGTRHRQCAQPRAATASRMPPEEKCSELAEAVSSELCMYCDVFGASLTKCFVAWF